DVSSSTASSGWPRVRIEIDPAFRMLDRGSPPARRGARGERVGRDLVDVIAARVEWLDQSPEALDGGGADRIPLGIVRSEREKIRPPAVGAGPVGPVVTIGDPAQAGGRYGCGLSGGCPAGIGRIRAETACF